MGKRQHQKDKMYLTYTEWTTLYGGKKADIPNSDEENFRRLPFDHCCVSLVPWENPYCDLNGNVFDLQAILDYYKKYKINPVTGEQLDVKSLTKLNFHKNSKDEYHCPVMYKKFSNNTHIVAVRTTGNVFSFEAVEQLNFKTKTLKDLLSDQPFARQDVITVQNPNNVNKFNLSTFYHIKNSHRLGEEDDSDANARLKTVSKETQEILDTLKKEYKAPEKKEASKEKADKFNAAHYSTGAVAAAFTSTTMEPETKAEAAIVEEDLVRYERVKKKAYVRVITNFGPLNLELHSDMVPKTCENFLKHCQSGYYNGTKFHRSIRNFMIQGGDPTGTGSGGQSLWGKAFEDEFKPNLTHSGRGILSMANSGSNTNKSQFFISYRSCRHLDNKHTVFGKVVGGLDTLNAIEKVEVDNKDRPIEDIIFEAALVFVDPYQEADEELAAARAEEKKKSVEKTVLNATTGKTDAPLKVYRSGVGKYIAKLEPLKPEKSDKAVELGIKKKKVTGYEFGSFSNW